MFPLFSFEWALPLLRIASRWPSPRPPLDVQIHQCGPIRSWIVPKMPWIVSTMTPDPLFKFDDSYEDCMHTEYCHAH